MDTIEEALQEARRTARELEGNPNSPTHVKARTMALVGLVAAHEAAGHVNGAQTLAARALECDRQLINRHIRRALARGWAGHLITAGRRRLVVTPDRSPTQTEFSDVVGMEHHPAGKPPELPPFSMPDPYAY